MLIDRTITSKKGNWRIVRTPAYSYTLLEKVDHLPYQKDFHLFCFFWGTNFPNSLVLQEFNKPFSSTVGINEITFDFTIPPSESHDELALSFYLDSYKETKFWIQGKRANTFRLGETLTIEKDKMLIHLTFSHLKGEGKFFGHIMKKNRPSQNLQPTKADLTVYDWQVGIRALRQATPCQIQVHMRWELKLN
ncbi:MAG TPA: hypothetical protein VLG44_00095 [Chlamydiales bacterium]|nr:hypothetical protein [Chlamydiales bacterium]